MFGLMKISTHEVELQKIRDATGFGGFNYVNPLELIGALKNERDQAKTRASTAEAEVVTLKAQLQETTFVRDAWKKSEFDCNTQYNKLQVENVALKARIAELEKPVPLPKIDESIKKGARRTGSRFKLTEAAKVPVKGKVEAKSGKVTK